MYNAYVLSQYIRLRRQHQDKDFCYHMSLMNLLDHVSNLKFQSMQDVQEFQAFWKYARTEISFTQMLEDGYQYTRQQTAKEQKKANLKLVRNGVG